MKSNLCTSHKLSKGKDDNTNCHARFENDKTDRATQKRNSLIMICEIRMLSDTEFTWCDNAIVGSILRFCFLTFYTRLFTLRWWKSWHWFSEFTKFAVRSGCALLPFLFCQVVRTFATFPETSVLPGIFTLSNLHIRFYVNLLIEISFTRFAPTL